MRSKIVTVLGVEDCSFIQTYLSIVIWYKVLNKSYSGSVDKTFRGFKRPHLFSSICQHTQH
jgi:hypothetical protein